MAGFGDLFSKGSTAEQFLIWGVLMQVLQPLLLPFTTELQKLVLSAAPTIPISANDAAEAVARGFIDSGTGQDKGNDNGIGEHDFTLLTKLSSHAPDLSMAFELYRRKAIPLGSDSPSSVSLKGALTDAGIPEDWHDRIADLAVSIPSQAEVLNAWLEGQIDKPEAVHRLKLAGMDPEWIDTAYATNGQAPTPMEALSLLNRKIIPEHGHGQGVVSYDQAFLEGPWRNKWRDAFRALGEYLPPPRTVTAMYHQNALTHDKAAELLTKQGLSQPLVEAYLTKSQSVTHATERHLTTSQITKAYEDGLLTDAQAVKALVALKFSDHDARVILKLVDIRAKTTQLNNGVTRVRSLYEDAKLTADQAVALLVDLKLDRTQAQAMVRVWHLTVSTRTKALSVSQIESAVYYGIISATAGIQKLQALGYDEADAWLAIAVRQRSTTGLPKRPAGVPPAPGPTPPVPPHK